MKQTWRWFGPEDAISLQDIRQAGASGIVTALHHLQNGAVWSIEEITARRDMIEAAGLTWDVVESIPVHEDIKTASAGWEQHAKAWAQSVRNLGACGITTVCYNFMPVLDWTRTNLWYELPDGARCLRFDATDFAAFDIHVLQRKNAKADHAPALREAAAKRAAQMSNAQREALIGTILAGLPGSEESYTPESFNTRLEAYADIGADELRANLRAFLMAVLPACEESGVVLAIHPDDPPRPIFGLPRVVSTAADMDFIANISDSPANGFTFCTGSYGVLPDNDLPAMLRKHGARTHFLHLRATKREADGLSFHEAPHLDGDVDMVAVVRAALEVETARGVTLPFRPDHGHAILDDNTRKTAPGYPLIGRLRGMAEIRGIERALKSVM
ncbi:Mannonate dehydratase [Aquimixticola soesokkakensis]|uniref:Mannonate dehydratase n=1 Tax=Aquimixticola soesokkakensis TaxID=1519096 RepID=A0A1Y5RQY1_9RHOB|nr:mannonate dehydratase [Aquimixticola soesokkakensis]SLN23195.1 Mannonate dehydratase [Aquimixticola soesokkakensis]